MHRSQQGILLVLATLHGCLCYNFFQQKVPNGDRIPHPCKPNHIWHGLGHKNSKGGGDRNPFGEDFQRNGFVWDKCLCEHDSDGDGKTNGQELGDPYCKWKPGDVPEVVKDSKLSHPGVCDSDDSDDSDLCKSKNDWQFCDGVDFHCPAFEEEGVRNFTIQIPKTKVPSAETTYVCMVFEIDLENDDGQEIMHIIGNKAQIDNLNVMHHIVVNSCPSDIDQAIVEKYKSPQPCSMSPEPCNGMMGGWTVGKDGHCSPKEYGVAIGKKARKTYAMMQLHWNNPEKRSDYMDGSGITYYYEKKKRSYDAGTAFVGPIYMEIPPAQSEWVESFVCKPRCTENLQEPKYISSILPHMHYLGRRFKMEHFRDGKKIRDLVVQNDYRYDSPKDYLFQPSVEVLPGDYFAVHCYFSSKGTHTWTYFGEGTYDEMCFGLVRYYPEMIGSEAALTCVGMQENVICPSNLDRNLSRSNVNTNTNMLQNALIVGQQNSVSDCIVSMYFNQTFRQHFAALFGKCDPSGTKCLPDCADQIKNIQKHACYTDREVVIMSILGMNSDPLAKKYRTMYHSCKDVPIDQKPVVEEEKKENSVLCDSTATANNLLTQSVLTLVALSYIAILTVQY